MNNRNSFIDSTNPIDTSLLACVVAVHDHQSFTDAAQALSLTQSAVSIRIKRLESQLGVRLVDRGRTGATLTADGLRLLDYARDIIALSDRMIAEMGAEPLSGTFDLVVSTEARPYGLARAIGDLRASFPELELNLLIAPNDTARQQFEAGHYDAMLTTSSTFKHTGTKLSLRPAPMSWAISNHFKLKDGPVPLAGLSPDTPYQTQVNAALDRLGTKFKLAYTCDSISDLLAFAASGVAVAAVPDSYMTEPANPLALKLGLPGLDPLPVSLHGANGQDESKLRTIARFLTA